MQQVNGLIKAFDRDGDASISKKEFTRTVKKMPNILQPAMFFQVIIKKFQYNTIQYKIILYLSQRFIIMRLV
jgi:hypothetical protein